MLNPVVSNPRDHFAHATHVALHMCHTSLEEREALVRGSRLPSCGFVPALARRVSRLPRTWRPTICRPVIRAGSRTWHARVRPRGSSAPLCAPNRCRCVVDPKAPRTGVTWRGTRSELRALGPSAEVLAIGTPAKTPLRVSPERPQRGVSYPMVGHRGWSCHQQSTDPQPRIVSCDGRQIGMPPS